MHGSKYWLVMLRAQKSIQAVSPLTRRTPTKGSRIPTPTKSTPNSSKSKSKVKSSSSGSSSEGSPRKKSTAVDVKSTKTIKHEVISFDEWLLLLVWLVRQGLDSRMIVLPSRPAPSAHEWGIDGENTEAARLELGGCTTSAHGC